MTSREMLALLVKRWYLVLLGAIITLGVASTTSNPSGIYWTQFNMVLLGPTLEEFPNQLEDSPYSLTPLAGLIVAEYNGNNRPMLTSSSDTTLFGLGDREGVMVRMPNNGNQWQPVYSAPNIDVQVTDRSPEAVQLQITQVTTVLREILDRRQNELGVVPSMKATFIMSSADPTIVYVSGSRVRALGMVALLGVALTIISIYWAERLLHQRRKRGASEKRIGKRAAAADSDGKAKILSSSRSRSH